jgi:D-amino-acid oxidase
MNPSILSSHPTTPLPSTAPFSERLELLRSLVRSQVVGFRPSRSSGPRVERGPDLGLSQEREDVSTRTDPPAGTSEVKVIYNYGHGGAGWQACWGAAEDTRDLVLAALNG